MSGTSHEIRVGRQGRVVIPVELRRELGIKAGQKLLARTSGNSIVLESKREILKRLRAAVPSDADLVGELLNERRREAAKDKRTARR